MQSSCLSQNAFDVINLQSKRFRINGVQIHKGDITISFFEIIVIIGYKLNNAAEGSLQIILKHTNDISFYY